MASPLPPMPGETPQQRQARLAAADALQRQIDEERQAAMRGTMIAAPMAMPNYITPRVIPAPMETPNGMPQGGLSVMDMGAAAMNSGPTAEQTARYLEELNKPGVIGGSWDADVGAYRMTARPDMAYPGGSSNFDESTGVYTPTPDPMSAFMGAYPNTNTMAPPTRVEEVAMDRGFNPVDWMNQPYTPVSPPPMPKPAPDIIVTPMPSMLPPQPMPAPTPDIVVAPRPSMMPTPPTPAFDPNQALNEYNAHLARIYQGGGQMDMDMIRAQQANLRDLQLNQQATAEQHDAGYRAALGELRNRYPDAFAA